MANSKQFLAIKRARFEWSSKEISSLVEVHRPTRLLRSFSSSPYEEQSTHARMYIHCTSTGEGMVPFIPADCRLSLATYTVITRSVLGGLDLLCVVGRLPVVNEKKPEKKRGRL